jgi:subtilisin-like proprotein convertase family protein
MCKKKKHARKDMNIKTNYLGDLRVGIIFID